MSHQPQRKEKNCLNCGTEVAERYCQHCGQENVETKQNFWALSKHFIYDVFHFDGKFFDTLKYLLIRPGFVPRQYISGKRMSYLDPIRMYLFTSAVFFLVIFSLGNISENAVHTDSGEPVIELKQKDRLALTNQLLPQLKANPSDSELVKQLNFLTDTNFSISLKPAAVKSEKETYFLVTFETKTYALLHDSIKIDPIKSGISNSWLQKRLQRTNNYYRTKYGDDQRSMIIDMLEGFLHKLPYLLFISLPFFALILKLLYVRRKNFYYSDHAILTLYQYIFTFILLLFLFLVGKVSKLHGMGFLRYLEIITFVYGGIYLFISMKKFYGQNFGKTLVKYLLLNFLAFVVIMILFVTFFAYSILK